MQKVSECFLSDSMWKKHLLTFITSTVGTFINANSRTRYNIIEIDAYFCVF